MSNLLDALEQSKQHILENQQLLLGLEEDEQKFVESEKLLDAMKNEVINHIEAETSRCDHDWRPDGESWRRTITRCDCSYRYNTHQFEHDARCSKEKERVRRYTCHCGASKIIKVDN